MPLAASEGDPASIEIVLLDIRLTEAARREGLTVIEPAAMPRPPEMPDPSPPQGP